MHQAHPSRMIANIPDVRVSSAYGLCTSGPSLHRPYSNLGQYVTLIVQYLRYKLHTFREHPKYPAVVVSYSEIWAIPRYTDVVELQDAFRGVGEVLVKGRLTFPQMRSSSLRRVRPPTLKRGNYMGESVGRIHIEEAIFLPPCRQKSIASLLG